MDYNEIMELISKSVPYDISNDNIRENLTALAKGYERYYYDLTISFDKTMKSLQEIYDKQEKKRQTWGTILNIQTLFLPAITKGIFTGLSDWATGLITMGTHFVSDVGRIFTDEGKGTGEADRDLGYAFGNLFGGIITGGIKGIGSAVFNIGKEVHGVFDYSAKEMYDKALQDFLGDIDVIDYNIRYAMLTGEKPTYKGDTGILRPGGFFRDDDLERKREVVGSHTFDWAQSAMEWEAGANTWVKDEIFSKIDFLPEGNQTVEFIRQTSESIGRMIPMIVSSYFGEYSSAISLFSKTYFYSSSFGGAFSEAIERGYDTERAFNYAQGVATIETLTEQIGGVQIGKMLPSGWFNVATSKTVGGKIGKIGLNLLGVALEEGMEEVYAEFAEAGLEHILTQEVSGDKDLMRDSMYAFLGGAISGAVLGGAGMVLNQKSTASKHVNLDSTLQQVLGDANQDFSKAQTEVNKQVDRLLDSYNSDSILDNNLIEEGKASKEQRLEAKKEMAKNPNSLASQLIEFNDTTGNFELSYLGKKITKDLKGYYNGMQLGKAIDTDVVFMPKNYDGGIEHEGGFILATIEDVNNIKDSKKQQFVKEISDTQRNVFYTTKMPKEHQGYYRTGRGVIYIDLNLDTTTMMAKTLAHETTHKMSEANSRGYNKLKKMILTPQVMEALKNSGIELMSETEMRKYEAQFFNELAHIENESERRMIAKGLVIDEFVANFVEKILFDETLAKKIFNISPELIETMDLAKMFQIDGKGFNLNKMRKTFARYSKQANQFKIGSIMNSILNDRQQTTYIKVGEDYFKVPKEITGFFNSDIEGNIEASLEEIHKIRADFEKGGVENRAYSEFSKSELKKFFQLFEAYETNTSTVGDIVDNLLLEYDNTIEYKEIIGTKFAYIWALALNNPKIRAVLIEEVNKRISNDFNNAVEKGTLEQVLDVKGMDNLYQTQDASLFRKIFALNYIIGDPRFIGSVSLYSTNTYKQEAKGMYLFNDGKAGFVVAKDSTNVDSKYMDNNIKKYRFARALYSNELSSAFNNEGKASFNSLVNYIKDDLQVKIIVAGNEKLESLYKNWGFTKENFRFEYSPEIMSEWSNSFNNFIVYNAHQNNVELIYSELGLPKMKTEIIVADEKISDIEKVFREDLEVGIKIKTETIALNSLLNESFATFDKDSYLNNDTVRTKRLNEIDLKELAKTENGRKRVALIESLNKLMGDMIRSNYLRGEVYNHLFKSGVQSIILELANNSDGKIILNKNVALDNIQKNLAETMAYIDNTFIANEDAMRNPTNPDGYLYTKLIHWGLRDLYNARTEADINNVIRSKKLNSIFDLLDTFITLDLTDNESIKKLRAGLKGFYNATKVDFINQYALDSKGEYAHTLPNVLKQHVNFITSIDMLLGETVLEQKEGQKKGYKKESLLGKNYKILNIGDKTLLDLHTFSNVWSLFMEESTGNVMAKRIQEAQIRQLEVSNRYNEHFESDNFLKKNYKEINSLEKNVSKVENLTTKGGEAVYMPNSQVIYLRDVLLREIIRNRMIENGFREGNVSNHFKDDGIIFINGNTDNYKKNIANRREVKITNLIDLFLELDKIVKGNEFMNEYNKKVLSFFDVMYEFENIRNKDTGLELTNDKHIIERLNEEQRKTLTRGLGDVDLTYIYVPMRSIREPTRSIAGGVFNIQNVIELGVDDGMVMGITETTSPPLIDTINSVIPQYARNVGNYYGLQKTILDLQALFNSAVTLDDGSKITLEQKVRNLSPHIVPFYESLLRDMSGQTLMQDSTYQDINKAMGVIKRNFFRASLGVNLKVVLIQFASLFTTGTMYGDFKGSKQFLTLKMMKNIFDPKLKQKAEYLIKNSELYKDRARNSIYEVGEARTSSYNRSWFNNFWEFTMEGINRTDSLINRALFVSLLEMGHSPEVAMKMTEEGIIRYQSSALPIGKSELLRTKHELIKVFTKFLSEPMKVIANVKESTKNLSVINAFEKNRESISQAFQEALETKEKRLNDLNENIDKLELDIAKEKDYSKRRSLEKELKETKKDIKKQEVIVKEQQETNIKMEEQIKQVIDKKAEVKKLLAKRVSALIISLSWQAVLGVAFANIRKQAVKDEEEEIWLYLSKQFGKHFLAEAIGYLPFVRDAYSLIIDKFDANEIGEFQAFNNLGKSINAMITDISNGGDFNYVKHLRAFALHLGQGLGIPTRQMERLFTTPTNYFLKSAGYVYRDITGQKTTNKELLDAIEKGDTKLVETIIKRKLNDKSIGISDQVLKELQNLAKNGAIVNPSKVPDKFSINGVEFKNNKDKFSLTYDNATFVVERLMTTSGYKRLDSEHKAKVITAVYNYYYNLAKQNVSGVEIYKKDRVYNMNQAYKYFNSRLSYYQNMQNKKEKEKRGTK